MDNLPHFFNLLKNNRIIDTAVTTGQLTDSDLNGLTYTRIHKNEVVLKNFKLEEKESFNEVAILMSDFGVLIDFFSSDTKYFENALAYFNTNAIARSKPSYIIGDQIFKAKGKKIGKFTLFEKIVNGAVMQSDLYGCKIMTGFYAEDCLV